MEKVINFIGDAHLSPTTPSSRKDDYAQAILDKITWIALNCPADATIFLGDMFTRHLIGEKYLSKVAEAVTLLPHPYAIVGNHDVPRHNIEMVDTTALGVLFKTGALKRLTQLDIKVGSKKYLISGVDYGCPLPRNISQDVVGILIAHAFYYKNAVPVLDVGESVITDDDLATSNFQHVILGHDHAKYTDHVNDFGQTIYRPGSLSRGSSHYHQVGRHISILRGSLTEQGFFATSVQVPSVPSKDVYQIEALEDKTPQGKDMVSFIKSFLMHRNGKADVFEVLDACEISDKRIRDYCEFLFSSYGFVRPIKESEHA